MKCPASNFSRSGALKSRHRRKGCNSGMRSALEALFTSAHQLRTVVWALSITYVPVDSFQGYDFLESSMPFFDGNLDMDLLAPHPLNFLLAFDACVGVRHSACDAFATVKQSAIAPSSFVTGTASGTGPASNEQIALSSLS